MSTPREVGSRGVIVEMTGEERIMIDASRTRDDGSDGEGTKKNGGLGGEGTIPNEPGGVGIGAGEPTTFEPEEDPEAAAHRDPEAPEPRSKEGIGSDPAPDVEP
jgi:hypothetical protein